MADHSGRKRLQSRGDTKRNDFTATVPANASVREYCNLIKEENRLQRHEVNTEVKKNWHNRVSRGGTTLKYCPTRSRREKVTIQLRANRAPFLRHTMHKFGSAENPVCEMRDENVEETAEHFLLQCRGYNRERFQIFGLERDPNYLNDYLESITKFVSNVGRGPRISDAILHRHTHTQNTNTHTHKHTHMDRQFNEVS